jgi:hypothetical protein
MIPDHPILVALSFVAVTFLTIWLFAKATGYTRLFLGLAGVWMILQTILGFSRLYLDGYAEPPRFPLLVLPPILGIIALIASPKGKEFMKRADIAQLTLIHSIRVPVEIILYILCMLKLIPIDMTFEGRNFDILAGLTAPIMYVLYTRKKISPVVLNIWNFLALGLLINIIVTAIFSVATPLQRFGFDQPNIAVAYFPYVWLPSVVVPIVMLSHIISIRSLSVQS